MALKINAAFCPHFHQPHFQLYRTREEAYAKSYRPWLDLLKEAVKLEGFYINLHFSGPFLYWMKSEHPDFFLTMRREIMPSGRVGLIGGLVDEAFPQLSSRPDDVRYQLAAYEGILAEMTGVYADRWQGIHVVEREAGELLLASLTRAARSLHAMPVFYLDAETFYEGHFSGPGGDSDYCLRHFGFADRHAITTISHLPAESLFFALRDEIGGQEYFSVPVHSQFRYNLLKRNSFSPEDRVRVTPRQYLYMLREAGRGAVRHAERLGRRLEPIVLMFEDAEKFGQWSGDPGGDSEWLMELFRLMAADSEIHMAGLRDYVESQGFLATYPARTSHSYPEWENWTARRGIRGVVMGDERLRRVICRLRDVERKQEVLERALLSDAQASYLKLELPGEMEGGLYRMIMGSAERYDFFRQLAARFYPNQYLKAYTALMRVRNMVYQEDPKWASRHPSYGSSPYYDMVGLSYLDVAERLADRIIMAVGGSKFVYPTLEVRDWDMDGREDVVVRTAGQMAVISTAGGLLTYLQATDVDVTRDVSECLAILEDIEKGIPAYTDIYRHSYPLVFTEADSDLARRFYPEGGRVERCRDFGRIGCAVVAESGEVEELGYIDDVAMSLVSAKTRGDEVTVSLAGRSEIALPDGTKAAADLEKTYLMGESSLTYRVGVRFDREVEGLILRPEFVTSATPSDEVNFRPTSRLDITGQGEDITWRFEGDSGMEGTVGARPFVDRQPRPQRVDYIFDIVTGRGDRFANTVSFHMEGCEAQEITVGPAVRSYYENYVFPEQSALGTHTSGLMVVPAIPVRGGQASFTVRLTWTLP